MTIRRRAPRGEPDIPASVIAMVLGGWRRVPPDNEAHDSGAAFDHFVADREGDASALMWALYEDYLRGKARAWHIEPTHGPNGDQFWGEYCVWRVERRERGINNDDGAA